MKQPEALRLADALTPPTYPDWVTHIPVPWHPQLQEVSKAAAELRRLSAIEEAAKNLVKVKGRFHTEQAFNQLKELLK